MKKSAPVALGSLPSGESDPVVTHDPAGADARYLKKGVCDLGRCLDLINDWDRAGDIDHSLAYELHSKLRSVWVALSAISFINAVSHDPG